MCLVAMDSNDVQIDKHHESTKKGTVKDGYADVEMFQANIRSKAGISVVEGTSNRANLSLGVQGRTSNR